MQHCNVVASFMPRFVLIPPPLPLLAGCMLYAASPLCVGSCARAFGYFSCQLASLGHTFRNATLITSSLPGSQAAEQPSRLRRRRQRVDKSKCRRDMSSPLAPPCSPDSHSSWRGVCIIHGTEPKKVPHSPRRETETATELAARLVDWLTA